MSPGFEPNPCSFPVTRHQFPYLEIDPSAVLGLPLTNSVTLDKLLNFSVPHSAHLQNVKNNNTCVIGLMRGVDEMNRHKILGTVLGR